MTTTTHATIDAALALSLAAAILAGQAVEARAAMLVATANVGRPTR